eukprot:TRINITY_DN3212_c1_g1_i1.p2 TRINITY_DN3212_c1_g1~~TRINITY_DN3212_c1_g1_i1.p2  ORF type:complete len:100 (+),score=1.42 TRINITY_DN3212_c1_g1_i1:469-768(+)
MQAFRKKDFSPLTFIVEICLNVSRHFNYNNLTIFNFYPNLQQNQSTFQNLIPPKFSQKQRKGLLFVLSTKATPQKPPPLQTPFRSEGIQIGGGFAFSKK